MGDPHFLNKNWICDPLFWELGLIKSFGHPAPVQLKSIRPPHKKGGHTSIQDSFRNCFPTREMRSAHRILKVPPEIHYSCVKTKMNHLSSYIWSPAFQFSGAHAKVQVCCQEKKIVLSARSIVLNDVFFQMSVQCLSKKMDHQRYLAGCLVCLFGENFW